MPAELKTVVTLTLNPAIDKSCEVDQVQPEWKLRCDPPSFHPGGGGINVARAINRLGGQAKAYWLCGGIMGDFMAQLLEQNQVDNQPLRISGLTRENLIVFEKVSGKQYRFGMPGPMVSEQEINDCISSLAAIEPFPEYLVLSGSLPPGVDSRLYARIAEAMQGRCQVILDTSGAALKQGLESPVFLIKPNIRELGQLAGSEIVGDKQIRDVARSLINEGRVEVVVTSLGGGGVAVTTAREHEEIRAPTVPIRSKVGAGDSMVGGIVVALQRSMSITQSVRFGVAAGSAAVMTEGTDLCRRSDTEKLFNEMCEAGQ